MPKCVSRFLGRSGLLLLVIASSAIVTHCRSEGNDAMNDSNSLAFIIEPREDRIFAGSTTVFDIRVENRSQHVVTFPNPGNARSPQPMYRLTHPNGQIEEFTPQRMAGEQASTPSDAIPLVTLEPEEGWFGELALDRLTDLAQPGRYELTATMAWEGVTIQATPVAFTVLNTNPEELSIALGIDDDGSLFCEAMLLQRSPDTLEAVAALLKEVDPRLGEMNVFNVVPRGGLPRNTYKVLGSYANYVDLVLRWTVALT
ncbi:MAG: hypothetical protein GF341_08690, partial [candidate division Zixibacteria bacterium]|nr:hypothetical protein [candidate division Zixibacteria bacterium]